MPRITINGVQADFTPGQTILQVANALAARGERTEIPQYCYHDGLSIVASCRICLGEAWAPNREGKLEAYMGGRLVPTCQTGAVDGMVVYTDSPKAIANQKAVMEYLLINHPLDCPVCDQSGECLLQDYSYEYGRGVSRFEEAKVKQPKKDVGPRVYLYSDRCIMCTRCVRFTREVTGTAELMVQGRGNKEEIDVFPGLGIANELSGNVIDLCPVGALLDKDFLFQQRVWFLRRAPSIDPLTASGDNIWIHHNEGRIYRVKPRTNMDVNTWWITDEVRYGWRFVHSKARLRSPMRRQFGALIECDWPRAVQECVAKLRAAAAAGSRVALLVSPMLACEEAFLLARAVRAIDPGAILGVGPIPVVGEDRTFKNNTVSPGTTATLAPLAGARRAFTVCAEKCPNARGVRRVLETFGGALDSKAFLEALGRGRGRSDVAGVVLTGNFPSPWCTGELVASLGGKFVVVVDTLESPLLDEADVVLPSSTWAEKSGTFVNHRGLPQAFERAIEPIEGTRPEGQIALDLEAELATERSAPGGVAAIDPVLSLIAVPPLRYDAAAARAQMAAASPGLADLVREGAPPHLAVRGEPDMAVVEL
ncbi:MAG: ferredoxin [Phycisphaerae bacterium]|nr:ferredoxin [Phycisphaerae bacterium]